MRQYLPNGTDVSAYSQARLNAVARILMNVQGKHEEPVAKCILQRAEIGKYGGIRPEGSTLGVYLLILKQTLRRAT
jgi:hypothetical protein